jgi:formylglycine-generating enzyme required for sulfatase activity
LVIGNSRYTSLPLSLALAHSGANAVDIAASLKALGYTLVTGAAITDAGRDAIITATEKFAEQSRHAKSAVFYYSGHGIRIDDDNYLLPNDVPGITGASMLKNRSVSLRTAVLDALEETGAENKVILLDCCRDGAFAVQLQAALTQSKKSASASNVGETTHKGPGFFFALATNPGNMAGGQEVRRNSPFTAALLTQLNTAAAVDVDTLFARLNARMTDGGSADCVPWIRSTLAGAVSLAPDASFVRVATSQRSPGSMGVGADTFAGTRAGQSWKAPHGTVFRWCPAGEFAMGSSAEDKVAFARDGVSTDDETQHRVTLSKGFWLSQHEVTQGEWSAVMGRSLQDQARLMLEDDTPYSTLGNKTIRGFKGAARNADPAQHIAVESPSVPIYYVSWSEASEYCDRLTARDHATGALPAGWRYALPTEAQWEYACRAGATSTLYSGSMTIIGKYNSPELDPIAWYGGNSSVGYAGKGWDTSTWVEKQYPGGFAGPRRVGQKKANAWGLCDMIGNVWEWCADWYQEDISNSNQDPVGPAQGLDRVGRGGSWLNFATHCRPAFRQLNEPGIRDDLVGFRPAIVESK